MFKNKVLTLIACFLISISIQAQKYGYLNSAQLLLEMPEIKQADAQLDQFQKELMAKGEQMVKAFEDKYKAVEVQVNKGELSQIQIQQKQGELGKEQQAIQQYQVEVNQGLGAKREELYKPILDKVKNTLDQLGKEMGYTMIFDTSTGSLLFVEEAEDLMPIIKQKLGI